MKIILGLLVLIPALAFADEQKSVPTKGKYLVPAPEALAEFARFDVQIGVPYVGALSTQLTYTFPKELSGDPALTVTLSRVAGTANTWESPEMRAVCDDSDELFSCFIYLKRETAPDPVNNGILDFLNAAGFGSNGQNNFVVKSALGKPIGFNKDKAMDFLINQPDSDKLQQVLDQFLNSEPAGILNYKYETLSAPYGQ